MGKVYDLGSSSTMECLSDTPFRVANILQSFKPSSRPRPSKVALTGKSDFSLLGAFFLAAALEDVCRPVTDEDVGGLKGAFFLSFTVLTAIDSAGVL